MGTNTLIFHFISISVRQRWDDVYDARVSSTRVVSEACWCLHATDCFVNIQVNIVLDCEWAVIQQWLVWKQWVWLLFCLVFKLSMWEFGLERCDCLVVWKLVVRYAKGLVKNVNRENPGNVVYFIYFSSCKFCDSVCIVLFKFIKYSQKLLHTI